ncbi:Cysteine protease atg4 [Dimargaris verticillata]|uniref:Cysteine protease n=1 Tax=Dimargaris verticillata TaxID=2761393 RepID=A0A9W8B362_9FUNG|nr:Cysteine protease atg4 [Dimargaris verticillata]
MTERSPPDSGKSSAPSHPSTGLQGLSQTVSNNVRNWLHALTTAVEQWSVGSTTHPPNELWLLGKRYVRTPERDIAEPSSSTHGSTMTPETNGNAAVSANSTLIEPPSRTFLAAGQPLTIAPQLPSSQTALNTLPDLYPPDFLADFKSRVWCTYRSHFPPLSSVAALTSDSGWGCMLRAAQSLVAQAFVLLLLGRDWSVDDHTLDAQAVERYRRILTLFLDHPDADTPLALHHMVRRGQTFGMRVGEWFGPHTTCHVLRDLVNGAQPFGMRVHLAADGVIYRDLLTQTWEPTAVVSTSLPYGPVAAQTGADDSTAEPALGPTIILVPTRLGIHQINQVYHAFLRYCFTLPQFIGIAGGKPSSAAYFIGLEGHDHLLYLDPHYVRPTPQRVHHPGHDGLIDWADTASFHCTKPSKIALSQLDPCMMLGFFIRNQAEFDDLAGSLHAFGTQEANGASVITIAATAPQYLFADSEASGEDTSDFPDSEQLCLPSDDDNDDDDGGVDLIESNDLELASQTSDFSSHSSSICRASSMPSSPSPLRPDGLADDLVDVTEAQALDPPVTLYPRDVEDENESRDHGIIAESDSSDALDGSQHLSPVPEQGYCVVDATESNASLATRPSLDAQRLARFQP